MTNYRALFAPRSAKESLWPSLACIWLIGLPTLKPRRWPMYVHALILVSFIVFVHLLIKSWELPRYRETLNIYGTMKSIEAAGLIVNWTTIGAKTLEKLVSELNRLEEEFKHFKFETDHRKIVWLQVRSTCCLLILRIIVCAMHTPLELARYDESLHSRGPQWILIYHPNVNDVRILVADLVLSTSLGLIWVRFELLNRILEHISEGENQKSEQIFTTIKFDARRGNLPNHDAKRSSEALLMEKVDRVCRIHRKLWKLARELNKAHSLQLCMRIPLFCYYITAHALETDWATIVRMKHYKAMIDTTLSFGITVALFLHVVVVSERLTSEANRLGTLLYRIPIEEVESQYQLQEYSVQLMQRKLVVTAAGITPLNYEIVKSIFSGVIKYVVFIFQLRFTKWIMSDDRDEKIDPKPDPSSIKGSLI